MQSAPPPRKISNPPNPFDRYSVEWLGVPAQPALQVYEELARSIVSKVNSPDIPFGYSINPYRGCFHGCAYCYARPSHQYLDFGAGTDFERKIVVKINAAAKLRETLMKKSWKGDLIVFSGNTDCYQPLEASYEITRQCLTVCRDFKNPVSIITKGALIRRDIELLQELHEVASVYVTVSVAFMSDEDSKLLEPYTPSPKLRFRVLEELARAGIPVGIALAPVIPAINDHQIPDIISRASDCGANSAFMTLLRLPAEVKDVFLAQLKETYPDRSNKVIHQLKEMKQGKLNRSEFGTRMGGEGERWEAIEWMFTSQCEKHGLATGRDIQVMPPEMIANPTFERPTKQLALL